MRAKILKFKGKQAIIEFEELPSLEYIERSEKGLVECDVWFDDVRYITDMQRKHYFALIGDISYYTGDPKNAVDDEMRYRFMQEKELDEFPTPAREQMSRQTASELIEFTITRCIHRGIPFRKQQWYLTTDISKIHHALTLKRICWISGRYGDIHHATNLIGMGGRRQAHDHEKSTFMCLSREFHNEIHNIGFDTFCKKYYVKPIRLNKYELKELGVM